MKRKTNKKLNGLIPYKIQSEAERKEVLWLIQQKHYSSIEDYEKSMTELFNGKAKDVNGKYIRFEKLNEVL